MPASVEPANLDGHIDPYASTFLFNSWVTDFAVFLNEQKQFVPMLASKWEFTPDGTQWAFTLRKDVKFHDDTSFGPDAFKFNIDRIMDPNTKSALRASSLGSEVFKGTTQIDDSSVRLNYDKPWVTVLTALAGTPMWSPDAVKKFGSDFPNKLTGTGAFKLTEWVKGSSLKFEKNPNYKGGAPNQDHDGPAYLDTITVKFVGEADVLGQVLKSGEVNMIMQLPAQAVKTYQNSPDFQIVTGYQGGSGNQYVMNTSHPPLDDLKVRQALRYAYDPEQLNQTLYDGLYLTMAGPLSKYTKCYWNGAEQAYSFDPKKANSLLDEAGWTKGANGIRQKGGKTLTLNAVTLGNQEIVEYLGTQFRNVGVELKIEVVPGPVQLQRAIDGDFDLMFQHLSGVDPNMMYLIWYSKNLKPGGWAWSRFQNDQLDDLLLKTTSTADPDQRCNLMVEAQKIVTANIPALPTVGVPVIFALAKKVQNFKPGAEVRSYFFMNNIYVEK
jgi:peptide/nickel transport system substrate-binding protein